MIKFIPLERWIDQFLNNKTEEQEEKVEIKDPDTTRSRNQIFIIQKINDINIYSSKDNFTKEEELQKRKEETEMQIILNTREEKKIRKEG